MQTMAEANVQMEIMEKTGTFDNMQEFKL